MKNYRRMGGTVNAETPEILLEMEKILVTKIRLWTISDIQPSSFLSYALNKRNPHRMKTLRLLSLVSQNGNEKSSKWTTQRSGIRWSISFQWSEFCTYLFQLAGNGGPPANVAISNILTPQISLTIEVMVFLSHTVSPFWPRYLSWAARSSSFCGTTSRRRTLQFLSPQSWDWSASLRRKYSGIKLLSFQLAEMVIISILSNLTRTQDLDLGPPKQILPSANTWGTDCRLQQQGKPKGDPRVWCCLGKRQHGNTSSPSCSGLQPHPGRAGLRPHRGGAFCNRPRRRPRLLWNLEEKGS